MGTAQEIMEAVRDLHEAEQRLAACRRRVDELCGIVPEGQQRKSPRKTQSRDQFRKGCLS